MDNNTFAAMPHSQPVPPTPSKKKSFLPIILFAIALLIVLCAGLYYRNHRSTPATPSLTLYYNDGKTVLWSSGSQAKSSAPAFATYVQDQLESRYGSNYMAQGAWRVTTTLEAKLQSSAQKQLHQQAGAISGMGAHGTAFIAQDTTNGQIVSWVSDENTAGRDSVLQKTEVGSLALPFTYAAFLERQGVTPETVLQDSPTPFPGIPCTNTGSPASGGNCLTDFDQKYLGPVTVAQAIAGERVVPAAEAASQVGLDAVLTVMKNTGTAAACYAASDSSLTQQSRCYLPLAALGEGLFAAPQHMIQAYATLANNGNALPQAALLNVSLNGKVKYRWKPAAPQRVLPATTTSTITTALSKANLSATLTTVNGTQLATIDGVDNFGRVASAVQYSSKYTVGFWATATLDSSLTNSTGVALSVTHGWMNDVQ